MRTDETYVILVNTGGGAPAPDAKAIEQVLYGARDWLRFGTCMYFIRTNLAPQDWQSRLQAALPAGAFVYVGPVDLNKHVGCMSSFAVEWFTREQPGLAYGH